MTEKLAVGIDLGGTNIHAALVNHKGVIVQCERIVTGAERGPEVVCDEIAQIVRKIISARGITRDDVIGLGVGAPGPLSHRDGVIYNAANLPGWVNVRLRRALLERTGLPTNLENDANAAAFGEFWAGAGQGVREMVAFTLGTGIGSGVISNGELLRGYFENAAELGHTIVAPGGLKCTCGQLGCLEQYASAGNVSRRVRQKLAEGKTSTVLADIKDGDLTAYDVSMAARDGDEFALKIWDEACYYIAVGCVNVQHAFNPERIVLAGGMSKAGDFLLVRVKKHFKTLYWNLHNDVPDISISVLGDDAGVIGAAGLAWAARGDGL